MTSTDAAPIQLGTGIDALWQTLTCASHTPHLTHRANLRSSRANQKSSPLLRLPAELRNKIYKYALGDWVVSLLYTNDDPIRGRKIVPYTRAGLDDNVWYAATGAILGLRSTCRQLREETGVLPYTLNNRFSWDDDWSRHELLNPVGNEKPRYEKTVG